MNLQPLWLLLSKTIQKAFKEHAGTKIVRKPHPSKGLIFFITFENYIPCDTVHTIFSVTVEVDSEICKQVSSYNIAYFTSNFEDFLQKKLKELMKKYGNFQQKRVEVEWRFALSNLATFQ